MLDQVSKIWVTKIFSVLFVIQHRKAFTIEIGVTPEEASKLPTEIPVIDGFFSIVHTQNEGAAFELCQDKCGSLLFSPLLLLV